MLGVEVAKIMLARFLEQGEDVKVTALTFNFGCNYELLNDEFKSKYFQGQDENQMQVFHWSDFLTNFSNIWQYF